jgi:hypothetical protein
VKGIFFSSRYQLTRGDLVCWEPYKVNPPSDFPENIEPKREDFNAIPDTAVLLREERDRNASPVAKICKTESTNVIILQLFILATTVRYVLKVSY